MKMNFFFFMADNSMNFPSTHECMYENNVYIILKSTIVYLISWLLSVNGFLLDVFIEEVGALSLSEKELCI